MKKLFILLTLSIFFFVGCGEDTLSLKEKCSKYLASSIERVERLNSESNGFVVYIHEGTFYSKKENSCITVIKEITSVDERTTFHDELTGTDIKSYPILFMFTLEERNELQTLIDKYEKELQLIK